MVPGVTNAMYWRSDFGPHMHYNIQLNCLLFTEVAYCGIVVTLPNKRQHVQSDDSMLSFLIVHLWWTSRKYKVLHYCLIFGRTGTHLRVIYLKLLPITQSYCYLLFIIISMLNTSDTFPQWILYSIYLIPSGDAYLHLDTC